ncbi:hypothetical protein [Pseudofrankia sp. DC12]|uniref:hypothetical protein n=1 Tax=Pseudofrankia sp. DC12 TaxID=683315 RepID=UPI000A5D87F4|nr:hypothetical protein [Pseudofrankia sp. DC12]
MTTEPAMPPRELASGPGGGAAPAGEDGLWAARARLGELPSLPVAEHVAVFEDVHRLLSGTLTELDAAEGAEGAGPGGITGGPPTPVIRPGQPPRPGTPSRPAGRPWPGGVPGSPRPGPPLPGPGGPR